VSDLTGEMHQLAADAATAARPMAVTEVIRRGNRRRTLAIAQRSIGGLSAIALGAVLFTGVTHHPDGSPAASSAAANSETVSVTQSSAGAHLTLVVKYRILPTRKLKLLSVTFSGDSKKALTKKTTLMAVFGPGLNPPRKPTIAIGFSTPLHLSSPHQFSGSVPAKNLNIVNRNDALGKNGSVSASLETVVKWTPGSKQPASHKLPKIVNPSRVTARSLPTIAILSS
jgi:hypothetical protein